MNKIILMVFLAIAIAFKGILVSAEALDERSMGAIVVTLGIALLLSSPILLMKKGWLPYAFLVNLLITIILYVQFVYIGYFNVPMSMYIFLQTANAQGMGESILGVMHWYHIIFFLDVVMLAALYFFHRKGKFEFSPSKFKWMKPLFVGVLIVGVALISLKPASMVAKGLEGEMFRKYTPVTFVGNYGIFGHQLLDMYEVFFQNMEITLDEEEKREIEDFLNSKPVTANPVEGVEEGMFEGKNVVYLQMESFQAFTMNQEVEGKKINPFLDSLVENSYNFTNFYPQTAEGNSSDAELLAMTSVYPVRGGSTFFRFPDNDYPSILKDLSEKGYESYAFHGDVGGFWNRDVVFPYLGFEHYHDIDDYEYTSEDEMGMGLSDEFFFRESAKMLNEKQEPFAGYLISLTSHLPFIVPEQEKTLSLEGELSGTYLGRYFESVHYADNALRVFFEELDEEIVNNTIFVIFGDHAGVFSGQKSQVEQWKGEKISEQQWMEEFATIPMLIYNPAIGGQDVERIGGQVDMKPMISHLMGTKQGERDFGVNLFTNERESVFLLKGDYGGATVIQEDGTVRDYGDQEIKALDFSEKLIRSNFK